MGTHASIAIKDQDGNTAGVLVGSDGHWMGDVLLDCAERWKNRINDSDPAPPAGTALEFAETLCGEWYGRRHNGIVVDEPGREEFHYDVVLEGGVVRSIGAYRREWDTGAFIKALAAGREPTPSGYRRRFSIDVAPVEVTPVDVTGGEVVGAR